MSKVPSPLEILLNPQQVPICATEAKHCLSHAVQLRIRETFSLGRDAYKISDASNKSEIYFRCQGRKQSVLPWDKKVLKDSMNLPVLNMKESFLGRKFDIHAGQGSDQEICTFKAKLNAMKMKISTKFLDALNPDVVRHLVLKGNYMAKVCGIYLGEPKNGGVLIARILRPVWTLRDDFIIEIAAGVDIALCVVMCIALHEQY